MPERRRELEREFLCHYLVSVDELLSLFVFYIRLINFETKVPDLRGRVRDSAKIIGDEKGGLCWISDDRCIGQVERF